MKYLIIALLALFICCKRPSTKCTCGMVVDKKPNQLWLKNDCSGHIDSFQVYPTVYSFNNNGDHLCFDSLPNGW